MITETVLGANNIAFALSSGYFFIIAIEKKLDDLDMFILYINKSTHVENRTKYMNMKRYIQLCS